MNSELNKRFYPKIYMTYILNQDTKYIKIYIIKKYNPIFKIQIF